MSWVAFEKMKRGPLVWVGVAVLLVLGLQAAAIVSIPLRLWRNGAIAREIVDRLSVRFPDAHFRGTASYERDVIYITLVSDPKNLDRQEVEAYLRTLKAQRRIAAVISLKYVDDGHSEDAVKI
jgi:hypothetical protein